MAEFYTSIVGLELRGGSFVDPASDVTVLELVHDPVAERPVQPVAGLFHLAFLYPDVAGLSAAIRRVLDAGLVVHGFQDHGVSEALYLADPEGNGVELYRDRPRNRWPRAGDELAMGSEPIPLRPWLDAAGEDRSSDGVTLGHVHLRSGDLAVSTRFYTDLGMDVTQSTYPGARFLAFDGYHHHVAVNTWSGEGLRPRQSHETGLIGFSILGFDEHSELVDPGGVRLTTRTKLETAP